MSEVEAPVDGRDRYGRALVAAYAFMALAACARSAVQISTRFDEAPAAFLLSGVSGVIYVCAAVALSRSGERWWLLGTICCAAELAGVITVGAISLIARQDFPEPTVWSQFGRGYGFVPLVLPMLGLLWQRRRCPPGAPSMPANLQS